MSLIAVASIIGQPFWGSYIDKRGSVRNVLIGSFLVSAAVILLIPHFASVFIVIIVIGITASFTESSMQSIIDSWTISCTSEKPWIDYGLTRGMGSLGYALTAVIFGLVIDRFGFGQMFYVHFAMSFLTIGFCLLVGKSSKPSCQSAMTGVSKFSFPLLSIGKSPPFIWFLVSSTVIYIGFRALSTFYPLLLLQRGGDNKALGLSLFIMAASEVPVLFASRKLLARFKDTSLITISMFFFLIRILLHALIPSATGLIAIQMTQALSFGLFLPSSVHYIKRLAPVGMSSTFLTIASSCYFGIGGILGSFLGGLIIDRSGIDFMLWCSVFSTLAGLMIFVAAPKNANRDRSVL